MSLKILPTDQTKYWIGKDKPMLQVTHIPYDKYAWERRQGAKLLNIPEDELADEPDYDTRIDEDRE